MRKHKTPQNGNHKWIGAVGEEAVDPELKAAMPRELRTEHLVLAENQEKNAHCNSNRRECARIAQRKIEVVRIHSCFYRVKRGMPGTSVGTRQRRPSVQLGKPLANQIA